MKLVDTSAWIDFMRRRGNLHMKEAVSTCLRMHLAAVTGPIITELFAGTRNEKERVLLGEVFGLCEQVAFMDAWWPLAGKLKQTLLRKGVSVPLMDVLIAVAAQESGIPILSADRDFVTLRKHAMPDLRVEFIQ